MTNPAKPTNGDPFDECECGATIVTSDRLTRAEAIAAWNTRADARRIASQAELVEAAAALRDDMLERARIAALLRKDGDIVVEAGNGVWFRFNEALNRALGEV